MTDQAHTIHNLTSSPRGGGIKWFLLVPVVLCGAGALTFRIANEFVIGYGLDYDGRYRSLKQVRVLEQP